ncbi:MULTISPECIES: class I SAM-dependent methyltransferase [unclassified Clostridium]|uniref:class I SAM-dependent DNA methyltransferase n=1 Tax=unclassified Clostridium TaxID=2614128 RepID=UPI00029724ED|nr:MULTISPECIES: class I SAM-dependent methyltransferase [unclassified Clostridium]EKQ51491.1 MAG: methyltransferase family protein [Clostridium sp. Maddingley MBC34-26]
MSFDEYAKNWDTEKRIKRAKVVAEEIIKSISDNENKSAMEFGCGTGLVSFNIYDKFNKVTLIDSSQGMIDILNSKINTYKIDNMVGQHLDIVNGDELNEKFDVIYNSMVLHHIHDIKLITNKFYNLLNEGGYLCIVDLNEEDGSFHKEYPDFDGHNGFNQEKLKRILASSGFYHIESKTFYQDEKIIDNEKINYSLFIMVARR